MPKRVKCGNGKLIDFDTLTPFRQVRNHSYMHACHEYPYVPPEFMTMTNEADAAVKKRVMEEWYEYRMSLAGVKEVAFQLEHHHPSQDVRNLAASLLHYHPIAPDDYETAYAPKYDVYGMGLTILKKMPKLCMASEELAQLVVHMLAWHPRMRIDILLVVKFLNWFITHYNTSSAGGGQSSKPRKTTTSLKSRACKVVARKHVK